ncbi:MAG: NUDIX domain-containing protein [Caldilineaceae bacterium]|nr:NUDIX domain-containing protein [Caldilineaceae bacterium]
MNAGDQGTRAGGKHAVIPRTLIFVTSPNPTTGTDDLLLLKGSPTKRLWAGKYNGLGGHVEASENVAAAAQRELAEETGLMVDPLTLRGIVHIDTGSDQNGPRPGVMMFVFRGTSTARAVRPSVEGTPEWLPVDGLADLPLVDDLYAVIPRTLDDAPIFFGHYAPKEDGSMSYHFSR